MKTEVSYNRISLWADSLIASGRYSFALSELKKYFKQLSDTAIKLALKRLTDKGKVLSIYKGYYLIVPPQYSTKGILPPQLFVDAFMKHLKKNYYVGLLNAAAYHGASHQQPQEYFIITGFPVLRTTKRKGLKINYISIKEIPEELIIKKKTEAGYLNVSNAVLTSCNLIQFEKRVGGINRAAAILNELIEVLKPSDFSSVLLKHIPVVVLQRLGYLLDVVCQNRELADELYDLMVAEKLSFFRIPLKAAKETKGFSSNNRWKVIVNTKVEIDE